MNKFRIALRKAAATFIFSSLSVLGLSNVLGMDVAAWKLAVSTGLGAVLNLGYRWSEAVVKEKKDSSPQDGP